MKTRIALLLALALLAGCEERKLHSEQRITMEVVKINPSSKTNSTVDLREVATGYVYKRQRLACSSQKAKRIPIGSRWDVTEQTYHYPESHRFTSELVGTRAICEKSN
jgi:hypothetical protein